MKVYGGNGNRVKNSGHSAPALKSGSAGGNNINYSNRGNNNTERSVRGSVAQPKQKKKGGKAVLIVLLVIALIVGGAFVYWTVTTKPPETGNNQGDNNLPAGADASPEITDTATREIGRYYTVMVVGIDQLNANTDTIMVARYDAVENKANLISIPRDTLVNVPNPVKKINAVYSYAESKGNSGIEALLDEVEEICGFRPDSYVFVNTEVFKQAIDCLGGVFYDVPVDMNYDDITPNMNYEFHIHVQKGYQLLDGENALGVFRFRQNNDGTGYGMGDIDRLETQHALIKEVAKQALQVKNLTKLVEIAQIVIDNSQTNMTYGNMQWYAQEFLKMSMDDINIMTLPGDYSCSIRKGSYVGIKSDEWITMVNQFLNPLKQPIKAENCNILYQVANDGAYQLNPSNFVVTDGGEVEGGLDSFYSFG